MDGTSYSVIVGANGSQIRITGCLPYDHLIFLLHQHLLDMDKHDVSTLYLGVDMTLTCSCAMCLEKRSSHSGTQATANTKDTDFPGNHARIVQSLDLLGIDQSQPPHIRKMANDLLYEMKA